MTHIAIWTLNFIDNPHDRMEECSYTAPFCMTYEQALALACKQFGINDEEDLAQWTIHSSSYCSTTQSIPKDLLELRCQIEAEKEPQFVEATKRYAGRAAIQVEIQKARAYLDFLEIEYDALEPLQPANDDLVF